MAKSIGQVGEKQIIQEIIRPLFNRDNDPAGVGDDCAVIEFESGESLLVSTDRVPADLISLKLGIIDFFGLGKYLTTLNISDIAASGGTPIGLLLNFGLPSEFEMSNFSKLLEGIKFQADKFGCPIVGGDLSDSAELSLSATSLGKVDRGKELTRRGARPGDLIYTSRPIGLTPAAFEFHLHQPHIQLTSNELSILNNQFSLDPLVTLGQALASSGICSSCMDNTDGLAQSLYEISEHSGFAFVLDKSAVRIPDVVSKVSRSAGCEPVDLALGPGADFSLTGTVSQEVTSRELLDAIQIIGRVEEGSGVWLKDGSSRREITAKGWSYFE